MFYGGSLHQVVKVLVHCPCLRLDWLKDGPKHHGCCGHVLPGVEEVLGSITPLGKLVA
jgi:hypothetical protein